MSVLAALGLSACKSCGKDAHTGPCLSIAPIEPVTPAESCLDPAEPAVACLDVEPAHVCLEFIPPLDSPPTEPGGEDVQPCLGDEPENDVCLSIAPDFEGSEGIDRATSVNVLGASPAVTSFTDSVEVEVTSDTEHVVLAVTALTDGLHDPEDDDWERERTYTWAARAGSPEDTGGADDTGEAEAPDAGDAEDEGCGCASAGAPVAWVLLGGLLPLARRRA